MSEVSEAPRSAEHFPTVPAIQAIRARAIKDLERQLQEKTTLSAEDRTTRDAFGFSTDKIRGRILSRENPEEKSLVDKAIIDARKVKAWLNTRGLPEYDSGPYSIETSPENGLDLQFVVAGNDYDVDLALYPNGEYQLNIDFMDGVGDQRPQYRSGKRPMTDGLTKEEAEIIDTFSQSFLASSHFATAA